MGQLSFRSRGLLIGGEGRERGKRGFWVGLLGKREV